MNLDEAFDMGFQVLSETGLDEQGWSFEFDGAERRFGACHYRTKKITLSASITEMNDREDVLETLLHEVAHARAGHKAGHGYEFVMECRALGIPGDRCYDSRKVTTNIPPYAGTCPNCGWTIRRWRKTQRMQGIACTPCCNAYAGGRYSNAYQLQWTREG